MLLPAELVMKGFMLSNPGFLLLTPPKLAEESCMRSQSEPSPVSSGNELVALGPSVVVGGGVGNMATFVPNHMFADSLLGATGNM